MTVRCGWLQSVVLLPIVAGLASAEESAPAPEAVAETQPAAVPVDAAPALLSQNDPNPFVESTEVSFALAAKTAVSLAVFDIAGRRVRTLAEGEFDAGSYSATWDGRDFTGEAVSAGIYFYRLEGQGIDETRKLVVLR